MSNLDNVQEASVCVNVAIRVVKGVCAGQDRSLRKIVALILRGGKD